MADLRQYCPSQYHHASVCTGAAGSVAIHSVVKQGEKRTRSTVCTGDALIACVLSQRSNTKIIQSLPASPSCLIPSAGLRQNLRLLVLGSA
eukprot:1098955-Rhodomonas_salina.4